MAIICHFGPIWVILGIFWAMSQIWAMCQIWAKGHSLGIFCVRWKHFGVILILTF